MKKYFWGLLYSLGLAAFTVYLLLDTFVIARVYVPVPETVPETKVTGEMLDIGIGDDPENEAEPPSAIITDSLYADEQIAIEITQYRWDNSDVYVADILLMSPEYLRTGLAMGAYGRNVTQTTSEMAEANGAILAVNGDYYGSRDSGYVLRNGVIYRAAGKRGRDVLVIGEDGVFSIGQEGAVTVKAMQNTGARHVLSFGPVLLKDGEVAVPARGLSGHANKRNPRTAIGMVEELHYVFVTVDGRTAQSAGVTVQSLAKFLATLGVQTAYNLDGGGSAAMVFNGKVVNRPTYDGKKIEERKVSDIVYIGY